MTAIQIVQFNKNLEKGDLALSEIIDYGFLLYGETRAGKTSASHFLAGNSLRGKKIHGEQLVEVTTTKNERAKIGNHMNSETMIPNFFQVEKIFHKTQKFDKQQTQIIKDSKKKLNKVYVVDTPGYGDTLGVLRILANGYYHYRLFSKIKNMKFILCFDINYIKNTASSFISSIIQFSSSFKDYLYVKQEIWQSCAFLFTKVSQETTTEDIIHKLQSFIVQMQTPYVEQVTDALKKMIRYMIDGQRIFCIKKVKSGSIVTGTDLLVNIDQKISKWWTRQYDQQTKNIDMEPVHFAISKQLIIEATKQVKCQEQLTQLIDFYNSRIKGFVKLNSDKSEQNCSFADVLRELVQDTMGDPDSHNFLNVMARYVKQNEAFFDDAYRQKRQKKQRQLFELKNQEQSQLLTQKHNIKMDRNYLIKKFQTLEKIQHIKMQINGSVFDVRNISWLQRCEQKFLQLIRQLNRISYKRSNLTEVIYKYGYIVYRIIEQAKIFLLLIELSNSYKEIKTLRQLTDNKFIDVMIYLKDFMGLSYYYQGQSVCFEDLRNGFIKKFNLQDQRYNKMAINQKTIDFFTAIQVKDDQEIQKTVKLILRYAGQVILQNEDKPIINANSINKLIKLLFNSRINCDCKFFRKSDQDEKENQLFLIRKTTEYLGKLLEIMSNYQLSRKVYDTIRFVDSVCRLYKVEIESLSKVSIKTKEQQEKLFGLMISYSDYLSKHFKQNQAMGVLLQAFELAQNKNELMKVKDLINDLRINIGEKNGPTDFEKDFFDDVGFDTLSEDLENEILNLTNCIIYNL